MTSVGCGPMFERMFDNVNAAPPPVAGTPLAALADYGEVFTRRWVVDFILDLVGYTSDQDLALTTIVEPACGTGAFLGPIVNRLLASAAAFGRSPADLEGCVRALDLQDANAAQARKRVAEQLVGGGATRAGAKKLAEAWVVTGDFLLNDHGDAAVDFVVGNPPYIRLEAVAPDVMAQYRLRCRTMRGRSDIYVGFIETALRMLKGGGILGFICADRWMHNQYGAHLREFVSATYAVDAIVAMHEADAFEKEVSAYPAVVILRNGPQGPVNMVQTGEEFAEIQARQVVRWARGAASSASLETSGAKGSRVDGWFRGRSLWPSGPPEVLNFLTDLEERFGPLEDAATGTRIGIGVATGCDDVYITTREDVVEEDRLLPLVRAADIARGNVHWSGNYLISPWDEDGLVDLNQYPLLKAYYEAHASRLRARHVARRRPHHWYRTIDRVATDLTRRQKLVLPDLKARALPVLDDGQFYPHHNLYFIVSDVWDLEVLGGILLSDLTNVIVGAYSVKMRGKCCRFQAQYLRRVRVPHPTSLSSAQMEALRQAFRSRDESMATAIAEEVYGVGPIRYLSAS